MKKSILVVILAIIPGISSVIAGDIWGGSLGVAYWIPEWDRSGATSSTSGIYGPSVSLRYRNFSTSVQYFTGKFDLEFDGVQGSYSADRTDLDLAFSYRFLDYFSVTAGYKNIEYDWNIGSYSLDASIEGFAIGLGAAYTTGNGILFYGSGSYLPSLDYQWNYGGIKDTYDADGVTLEGGIGYLIKPAHLLVKAGYRYQNFSLSDAEPGTDLDETTDGFRFELAYLF